MPASQNGWTDSTWLNSGIYNTSWDLDLNTSFEAVYVHSPRQLGIDDVLHVQFHTMQSLIEPHFAPAQTRMKEHTDNKTRTEHHFSIGEWVYLKL